MIIKDILETYDIEKDFNNLINKIYETETNG